MMLAGIAVAGKLLAAPSAATIIARSVEANQRDWQAAPRYSFYERDRVKGGTRTYHVMMIEGSPYNRLVALNGKPLGPEEDRREQEKLDQVVAERPHEGAGERQARIKKYQRDRRRDHAMMAQLTDAFNFTLEGERVFHGRRVYLLKARPRPGYRPPTMETKALTGMQGQLWIDSQSYQWVKVEARVVRPVEIEGVLAQVEPGTRFELENAPVSEGIWLPSHYAMRAKARILWVYTRHDRDNETYFGYQPAVGVVSQADR